MPLILKHPVQNQLSLKCEKRYIIIKYVDSIACNLLQIIIYSYTDKIINLKFMLEFHSKLQNTYHISLVDHVRVLHFHKLLI